MRPLLQIGRLNHRHAIIAGQELSMQPIIDLDALGNLFLYLSAFLGAIIAGLWLSLVIWTLRDIRSRTRDRVAHALSALVVLLLNLPGLLIYIILRPPSTLDEKYQQTLEEEALLAQIETNVACPGCGTAIHSEWQICPHCHTRLHKPCENCGRLMELPWQLCPYCGHQHSRTRSDRVKQDQESADHPA
jgi:RNA polymerase subunit RPABC4/transcription elongation factor Spt4